MEPFTTPINSTTWNQSVYIADILTKVHINDMYMLMPDSLFKNSKLVEDLAPLIMS